RLVVDHTARLLGEEFPDVIALRYRLAALRLGPLRPQRLVLSAPPMLAASWAVLTQPTTDGHGIASAISKLFWFPFTVESTSTWFVWTEMPNTRTPARGLNPPATTGEARRRDIMFSRRGVEFETPPSEESVRGLLSQLLSSDKLQPWVRHLKD